MVPQFAGKIVEWDQTKRCGWIEAQGQRIFVHIRDFSAVHRRPEVGDVIKFAAGTDAKGRICATKAEHVKNGGRFSAFNQISLLVLLILPSFAVLRQKIDLRFVGAYAVAIATVTYLLYAHDKRRARAKEWRVSESTLHLFELIGGWPGAFVAQRHLRHKCSKAAYLVIFWLIVLIYQYAAIDSLFNWKLSRGVIEKISNGLLPPKR